MISSFLGGLQIFGLALLGASVAHVLASIYSERLLNADALAARVARDATIPLWREDGGRVIWANPAYHALKGTGEPFTPSTGRQQAKAGWYSVTRNGDTGQAVPVDALVRAEADLGQMVQTMAKTFAHLPIGLAVFDRDRHLHIFNPALADLTSLSPEFLSRRPSLVAILDAMRNRRMVPEPANWKDWRRSIAQMEQAATAAHYDETWSLPGGQTYRVTGRPHPDGALALMVEDISSETIRSRRHRADLELCQGVIDTLEDAMAVFSASGRLVMSNIAYSRLWGHEPSSDIEGRGIRQLCAHWRAHSAPAPIWAEAEDFVATLGPRPPIGAEARLTDGRLISCHFVALADGASLARFHLIPPRATPRAIAAQG